MNQARIGTGSIIGAGAVVLEGFECPPYSLVVGSPTVTRNNFLNLTPNVELKVL